MRRDPARHERHVDAEPVTAPIVRWSAGDPLPRSLHRALLQIRDRCFPDDVGDPLPRADWRWLIPDGDDVIAHAAGRRIVHTPEAGPSLELIQVAYVGVSPEWQGRGLAGRLIRKIEQDLPDLGLDAAVLQAAAAALPIYLRCGFKPIAPRVRFLAEGRVDADPVLAWAPIEAVVDALRCECWVFESDW